MNAPTIMPGIKSPCTPWAFEAPAVIGIIKAADITTAKERAIAVFLIADIVHLFVSYIKRYRVGDFPSRMLF